MKVKELLEQPLETLLVTFFNAAPAPGGGFAVISRYRAATSKYATKVPFPANSYEDTAAKMSAKYGLDFKATSGSVMALIENEQNLSLDDFLDLVYQAILPKINDLDDGYDLDAEMALALFMPRGSMDFTMSLCAVDLKYPTPRYVGNIFKVLLSSDDLISRLNLNFREFQPQYVNGEVERNTQIRVNLKWFYDHVAVKYNLNQYKLDLLSHNIINLGETWKPDGFSDRIIFYQRAVLGKTLTAPEIEKLRKELEFSEQEAEAVAGGQFDVRNQKIVAFARETFPDECVGCHDHYSLEDRSFIMPRTGRYYLEVNHVIAYASDSKTVDVVDNLVKLCPACHRALAPGRAEEGLQKEIIEKMITSRKEVGDFVGKMASAAGMSPLDYVYKNLK